MWYLDLNGKTFYLDEYGRPLPDPNRWPSSKNGTGFSEVARNVHALGLSFGIHTMRGISQAAFDKNTPVKGTTYTAKDVALTSDRCPWDQAFMSVNLNSPAGHAFYNSLYQQYADWGVDYIKNDCMFGVNYVQDQINAVSQAISNTGKNLVYSLSPGDSNNVVTEVQHATQIQNAVNLYRVTDDGIFFKYKVFIYFSKRLG